MSFKNKIKAITPMVCIIIYLLLGFTLGDTMSGVWAWGLLIFLLCPIMPYLLGEKKITLSVSLVIIICYILLGIISTALNKPLWHPGWVMFLLIPIIHILISPSNGKDKDNVHFKRVRKSDDDDNIYDAK